MNRLSDLNVKPIYYNQKDVEDFYSSVLKYAKNYKRVSAYFTVGMFKFLSKGLNEFINNDGYMQLLISTDVDKGVIEQIIKGYEIKDKNIIYSKNEIYEKIKHLTEENDKDIFSYLIAIGKLDVKMVYKQKGIFHDKFGIISDNINNLVYIGSNNFTEASIANNDESFQVTIDWDNPSRREKQTIEELNCLFDCLWNNKKEDVLTIDLPDPIIEQLISSINYNELKTIKENLDYLRFDFDQEDNIILTSNINMNTLFNYNNLGEYSTSDFLEKNEKYFKIKNLNRIDEIYDFKSQLFNVCKENKVNFYLTKKADDYFKYNYRDYQKLADKGNWLKNKEFINTDEFIDFKKTINSILKRPLKDMQVLSAIHIVEMEKSLNFSVPGSGKTATVIGAFEYLFNKSKVSTNRVDKLVVIGPVNCSKSWRDEYKIVSKESFKHPPLCLINSDSIADKRAVLTHDFETSRLIIINYEILPKIDNELAELLGPNTMVVFDEIHRIKKIDGPKYNALKKIIKKTVYKVALTGTPLPNGYIDLFNMMSLLHGDYVYSYFEMFESTLKNYDARYRKIGLQNDDLNKKIYPFYMRVSKKDLNVPPAEPDHLIYVDTNKHEKDLYFDILKKKYNSFESTIKLTEIGCVPFKLFQDDDLIDNITTKIDINNYEKYLTSKLFAFLEIFKKDNKKAVVWCVFVDTINLVCSILGCLGYKCKAIYGETSQEDRDKYIDEFNYGDLQVIVTNPATLAESVSLHKSCHIAHYLELNYNLYHYLQSRDRIHRLGLKDEDKTNYYIYFNFYDTEMKISKDLDIYKSLKKKEELMQKSIDKGNFVFDDLDKNYY